MRPRRGSFEPPRRPEPQVRINDAIRVPRVRLIGEEGQQLGIKQTDEARTYAYGKGLDLVEVAPQNDPPVAKVMRRGERVTDVRDRLARSRIRRRRRGGGALRVARAQLGPRVDDEQSERDDRRDDRECEEDGVYGPTVLCLDPVTASPPPLKLRSYSEFREVA